MISLIKSCQSYVNMPSEVPLSIPGLPAGWKFGDEMPTGFVPEPEKPNVALEIAQSSQKKRRRPDQPVIFQVSTRNDSIYNILYIIYYILLEQYQYSNPFFDRKMQWEHWLTHRGSIHLLNKRI